MALHQEMSTATVEDNSRPAHRRTRGPFITHSVSLDQRQRLQLSSSLATSKMSYLICARPSWGTLQCCDSMRLILLSSTTWCGFLHHHQVIINGSGWEQLPLSAILGDCAWTLGKLCRMLSAVDPPPSRELPAARRGTTETMRATKLNFCQWLRDQISPLYPIPDSGSPAHEDVTTWPQRALRSAFDRGVTSERIVADRLVS